MISLASKGKLAYFFSAILRLTEKPHFLNSTGHIFLAAMFGETIKQITLSLDSTTHAQRYLKISASLFLECDCDAIDDVIDITPHYS